MTTYTTEEIAAHFKLWLDELRSGKYMQGQGHLCVLDPGTEERMFCCLGVGEVAAGGVVDKSPVDSTDDGRHILSLSMQGDQEWTESLASPEFARWLGLEPVSKTGSYLEEVDFVLTEGFIKNRQGSRQKLTTSGLNDEGFTFEQIADLLEYFGIERVANG
jgi:hypothetical protein